MVSQIVEDTNTPSTIYGTDCGILYLYMCRAPTGMKSCEISDGVCNMSSCSIVSVYTGCLVEDTEGSYATPPTCEGMR